jgi:hypothetical protein
MKTLMTALAAAGFLVAPVSVNSLSAQQTDPQPTCRMCEGTYLPATEIQDYLKKALAEKRTDQQARDVDIGKAHIGIGVVYRGKLDAPAPDSVAEHDLVSEVYYIMSGSGTLVLGPDIADLNGVPRPPKRCACLTDPATTAQRSETARHTISIPGTWSSFPPEPGIGSPRSRITSAM